MPFRIFPILSLVLSLSFSLVLQGANAKITITQQEKAFIASKQVINLCIGPNFMPYEDIIDGQYVGMISEYMKIVSDNIGMPFELVATKTWNATMEKIESRQCDIVSLIIPTPERRKFMNFTEPYIGEPFVIATTENKPFVVNITDVLDQKLAAVAGYAYVEIYKTAYPEIQIVEVESVGDGLKLVRDGEVYGYMGGLNVIGYNIQKLGYQDIKINGTLGSDWDVTIGSRNDMPLINDLLNKSIKLITDSQRRQIKNSWMTVTFDHGFDYKMTLQIGVVVLLIFCFMFYRQMLLRRHNKILETLSETDKLTSISNRLKLDKFLQYHLDLFERYHEPFSIILIDIDHFKKFNDTFGHLIGDKVLAHVASLLKSNCRKLDMVGRWGGEEFLMICPKTKLGEIEVLAETLRGIVEKSHLQNIEGVTISLGIAQMKVSDNFNTIISRADKALFKAKENGRNRVENSQ